MSWRDRVRGVTRSIKDDARTADQKAGNAYEGVKDRVSDTLDRRRYRRELRKSEGADIKSRLKRGAKRDLSRLPGGARSDTSVRASARSAVSRAATAVEGEAMAGSGHDDDARETFRRAEDAAMMGPPVEASLDPLTAPEETQHVASGEARDSGALGVHMGVGGAPRRRREQGAGMPAVDDMVTGGMGEREDGEEMGLDVGLGGMNPGGDGDEDPLLDAEFDLEVDD